MLIQLYTDRMVQHIQMDHLCQDFMFKMRLYIHTPLNTCLVWFMVFQLYRGGQFYWWKNPGEYPEKTTELSQVTERCSNSQL